MYYVSVTHTDRPGLLHRLISIALDRDRESIGIYCVSDCPDNSIYKLK